MTLEKAVFDLAEKLDVSTSGKTWEEVCDDIASSLAVDTDLLIEISQLSCDSNRQPGELAVVIVEVGKWLHDAQPRGGGQILIP